MESNINNFLIKLGHDLEEIRIRALSSLILKLDHGLLKDEIFVNEKMFFIHLLEWFNFSNVPMKEEVLNLLLKFSKYSSAAAILKNVGAIEFLRKLRNDLEKELQILIDNILDNLFIHFEDDISDKSETKESPLPSPYLLPSPKKQIFDRQKSQEYPFTSVAHISESFVIQNQRIFNSSQQSTLHHGYCNQLGSSITFSVFPWLCLTNTDKHILSSTECSLKSSNASVIISSCEFLNEVLFQDFPAEVFLQRSGIVQNLLHLLNPAILDNQEVCFYLMKCLITLVNHLTSRIIFHQHPIFYEPKCGSNGLSKTVSQSLSSSDTGLSMAGHGDNRQRGDGQDNDSSSSGIISADPNRPDASGDAVTIDENILALQLLQMTVPQFCIKIINNTLLSLKSSSLKLSSLAFLLFHKTLSLLILSVDQTIWNDSNSSAVEMTEQLLNCFESLGELLLFHHHQSFSLETSQEILIQHRLIFSGIANFTAHLLNFFVPLEQAETILPYNLITSFFFLIMDEILNIIYPHIREIIIKYVEILDKSSFQIFIKCQYISKSMVSACLFFRNKQLESCDFKELLHLAEASLPCASYHQLSFFIEDSVKLCSEVCASSKMKSEIYYLGQEFIVKLIMHPDEFIQKIALEKCSSILKDALDISKTAGTENKSHFMANFMIHEAILTQLCYAGLKGNNKEIAQNMLLRLLQGQLLMNENMWINLIRCLEKTGSLIISFADTESFIGNCVFGLLETNIMPSALSFSEVARLKGCLCLLFSSSKRIRAESLCRLVTFLSKDNVSDEKLPIDSEICSPDMVDLLIIDPPHSLETFNLHLPSAIQEDSLLNIFNVYMSVDLKSSLKRQAIEQLVQILKEPHLHNSFISAGGVEDFISIIQNAVLKNFNLQCYLEELVPLALTGLRYIFHYNHEIHSKFQDNIQFYLSLFRVTMMLRNDTTVRYNVAHILTLLLFNISYQNTTQNYFLPKSFLKIFKIPFEVSVHSHNNSSLKFQYDETLLHGISGEFLRLSWNIAWHDGIEPLIVYLRNLTKVEDNIKFSEKLKLTAVDKILLLCTPVKNSINQVLIDISNSTSHKSIQFPLHLLTAFIIMGDSFLILPVFLSLDWKSLFSRFLLHSPVSVADEELLREICFFIMLLLSVIQHPPEDLISWLWNILIQVRGPFMILLDRLSTSSDLQTNLNPADQSKSKVYKDLLMLVCCIIKLQRSVTEWKSDMGSLTYPSAELVYYLVRSVNIAEGPHFYNLASLECTLVCLMHLTARPCWSQDWDGFNSLALCSQLLQALLEIIAAFHIGRGGTSLSYMGRGVTRNATLCLRHLIHEMTTLSHAELWINKWLLKKNIGGLVEDVDLTWLISLWAYRDSEVRAAGLGIAAALTTEESGLILMTTYCQHITGGIWGAAFSFLLDESETVIVREQAAFILVNLTSQTMPDGDTESDKLWKGPLVRDTETNVSLVGLPALLVLLQHYQFYSEVRAILSRYYPHLGICHKDIVIEIPTTSSSPATLTTLDIGSAIDRKPTMETSTPRQIHQDLHQPVFVSQTSPVSGTLIDNTKTQDGSNSPSFSSPIIDKPSIPYSSVTAPSLVTALCKLLKNLIILAPEEAVASFKEEGIIQALINMLSDESWNLLAEEYQTGYPLHIRNILKMFDSIMQLFIAYAYHDANAKWQIPPFDSTVLLHCFKFFRIHPKVLNLETEFYTLWSSIFEFSEIILNLFGKDCLIGVSLTLQQHWDFYMSVISTAVEKKDADKLCKMGLKFTNKFISEDGGENINSLLSLPYFPPNVVGENETSTYISANVLTKLLIKLIAVDSSSFQLEVFTTLKLLLGINHFSKRIALQENLIAVLLDYIKQIHAHLNLISLERKKQTVVNYRKEQLHFDALINIFAILQNFLYNSPEVKEAAVEHKLGHVILKLWNWCLIERQLLVGTLTLLCTFTSKCSRACISLTHINSKSRSSNSLLECIIKLTNSEMEKHNEVDQASLPTLNLTFTLLTSLVLTSECRSIMWKSHFFEAFSSLQPQKPKKNKFKDTLELLWLKLIVNLSFSPEGQQFILKIKDSTKLLMEYGGSSHSLLQEAALLVIRNLCFYSANKLLTFDMLISLLLECIINGTILMKNYAVSGLWALTANNNKGKMIAKNADVIRSLEEVRSNLLSNKSSDAETCLQSLETLLALIRPKE